MQFSMGCLVEKSQNMLILTLALLENTSGLEIDLCGVYPVFGAHNGLLWVAVSTLKWLRYAIFHGMFGGEMPLKIPKYVHIDTCLIRKYLLGEKYTYVGYIQLWRPIMGLLWVAVSTLK